MRRRVNLLISGRVQGVGFRASTQKTALRLGVAGHAKNLPDGRVEIIAEATSDVLDEFIAWCHQGPRFAKVEQVLITELLVDEPLSGFGIIR